MKHKTLATAVACGGTAVAFGVAAVALAGPAAADPLGRHLEYDCTAPLDFADAIDVVVPGKGEWTPAHDLSSRDVYVPLAFREVTYTVLDAQGAVLDSTTLPPTNKGSDGQQSGDVGVFILKPRHNDPVLECAFRGEETGTDESGAPITTVITGFVVVK